MPVTPSNRQLNVLSCSFTPEGGTLTAIKGVQTATLDYQPDSVSEGGDGDTYNTVWALTKLDPMISLDFINVQALSALVPGVSGTLTFTVGDARNQGAVGGGGTVYTVVNACYMPRNWTWAYRQLGRASAAFNTFSADGQTSPISSAAA